MSPNYSNLLLTLQRYAEAEVAYRKAIALDPKDSIAYDGLGILLREEGRLNDAETAHRTAIKLDPDNSAAYTNLGYLLRSSNRLAEAVPVFQKSQRLETNFNSLLCLAGIHKQLGNLRGSIKYASEASRLIPVGDWYNIARLESIRGNVDAAFENLRRAAQQVDFDHAWAWRNSDLEWIRADPRFREIVGPPPESNG
ncbi:MAG: tetratricopeptide repeat protein [Chloroflexi bacterium]|nr:tetratricopeptide repeat protein [Chloroflexota bacterium]